MSLYDFYNLDNLRNRSAEIVYGRIERFLEQHEDFCHCEQCVLDLLAYVLNHVTPMYGTSLLDPLSPNPDREKKIDVEIDLALKAGSKRVAAHPNHDS
ncbi:MAG: late competence development ComFB family protein [Spirochaetaceae bacterium]|nr:MAG: late competence development ComFB family protein [Spirochaetaceae bacterium]